MKSYGILRDKELEFPDCWTLQKYGLKGNRTKQTVNSRNYCRRYWKKRYRRQIKRELKNCEVSI